MGKPQSHDVEETEISLYSVDERPREDSGGILPDIDTGLRRGLGLVSVTMMGFLTVAILSDIAVIFTQGLITGGPVVLFWGYIVSLAANLVVATSLAEICAAFPTSGSVYNWSAQVVPEKLAPLASYTCGWFNYFGYLATSSVVALTFSDFLDSALIITVGQSYGKDQQALWAIITSFSWAAANIMRIDEMGSFNTFMGFLHGGTIIVMVAAVLALPSHLNSSKEVFTHFHNETGISSSSYVSAIGLLVPAYCFLGYDAAAHLADETTNAEFNAPASIISTCLMTGISGVLLILALLYTALDIDAVLSGATQNSMVNTFNIYLPHEWAVVLSWLVTVNVYFAGLAGLGVCSRVTLSFAKDCAMPFSALLKYISPYFSSPLYSIFFVAIASSLLILLVLADKNEVAFNTLVGLAVVGMQVSYALPILFKLIYQPKLPSTPFSLGRMSPVLGIFSCCWIFTLTILAFLPTRYPYTIENFNWAFLVAIFYGIISTLNWQFNSRHFFTGPARIFPERYKVLGTAEAETDSRQSFVIDEYTDTEVVDINSINSKIKSPLHSLEDYVA